MDRDANLAQLRTKLEERNYPAALIQKQFGRAKKKGRRGLIFQERKDKRRPDDKARLILTDSTANPPIDKWVRERKKLLTRNDDAKALGDKIQIGSKHPKICRASLVGLKMSQQGLKLLPQGLGVRNVGAAEYPAPF